MKRSILLLVVAITGANFHATLFLTPVVMIPIFFFVIGWSLMVSSLTVFFRDLQYILDILLGAAFYLTPIIYEPSQLPLRFQWIVHINPMARFVWLFRQAVYHGHVPALHTYAIALGTGLTMCLAGWIVFHKTEREFLYWF